MNMNEFDIDPKIIDGLKVIRDDPQTSHVIVQYAIKALSCHFAMQLDIGDSLKFELMRRGVEADI
jgi:hypothetical protein